MPKIHLYPTKVSPKPQIDPGSPHLAKVTSYAQIDSSISSASTVVDLPDPLPLIPQLDRLNDSDFDRLTLTGIGEQRTNKNFSVAFNIKEILKKQNLKKDMHVKLNELTQHLVNNSASLEKLKWAHRGTTIAMIAASIISFALALATGGFSLIFSAIAGAAGTVNGMVGSGNNIKQMEQQKLQGLSLECREAVNLENAKIQSKCDTNHQAVKLVDNYKHDAHVLKANRDTAKMLA